MAIVFFCQVMYNELRGDQQKTRAVQHLSTHTALAPTAPMQGTAYQADMGKIQAITKAAHHQSSWLASEHPGF